MYKEGVAMIRKENRVQVEGLAKGRQQSVIS